MQILNDTLLDLILGDPAVARNLTAFPLLSKAPAAADYLTLDEAMEQGGAVVSEVSEGGRVPELAFENKLDRKVLLLDGEELIGAKQNRILNLTILVAAGHKVTIPVSCVEHGRWSYRSRRFSSGKKKLYASLKAKKMRAVSESLRRSGERRSDQGEIWDDIAFKCGRMGSASETGCMDALYEDHAPKMEEFVRSIRAADGQVGAVFMIGGRVVGLELFDSPATFARVLDKIVESFALDAIEYPEAGTAPPAREVAQAFLRKVAGAQATTHTAVDLGQDVRLSAEQMEGGALIADGRILHLSAFNLEEPDDALIA
jgi:hypothetical protein